MELAALSHPAPCDSVFIHGAGSNNLLWSEVLQALSGGGTALAPNLPGHPTGDILCKTIDEYSEAVFRFIREGPMRPVLCGHSMGGAVALSFALRHPDSVTGLILVATGAKMGVLPDVLSGLREDALGVIQKTITPLSFHSIDIELGRKARAALSLSNPDVFLNDYLACTSFDVRDRLGEITAPTLILCGDDDRMTPPKWSQYLHSNIPNSREPLIIRDAGHMLPLEKPTECASLIQGFLLDLSR